MTKSVFRGLVLAIGAGVAMTATAAGDLVRGKELFQVCTACHGENGEGNTVLNTPVNGGQNAWYVTRQLKNFKAGIRGAHPQDTYGNQMRPMAMTLADDQAVEDVAAYVESLSPPRPPATVTGNAAAGKQEFEPCMACHGQEGQGSVSLNAPQLSGQHDWYIVRQIKNFKAGVRGAHPKDIYGSQMRPMAQLLATDNEINDVVAYLNSVP